MDIVARARNLITQPATEWRVIAAEPADTPSLFTSYAVPLALIPALCGLIGTAVLASMFGTLVPGLVRPGLFTLLLHAVVSYVLGLAAIWVMGKLIQQISPRFGGTAEEVPAMKLAVYSPTASWLAGVFLLFPQLAILGLLGLYSLYLFYVGAPVVLRMPQDRVPGFIMVLVVVAVALYFLVGLVAGLLLRF